MLLNICIPEETPHYVHGFSSLMNKDMTGSFFKSENWTDFHGDVDEELPVDMPKPLGEPVRMTAYVD